MPAGSSCYLWDTMAQSGGWYTLQLTQLFSLVLMISEQGFGIADSEGGAGIMRYYTYDFEFGIEFFAITNFFLNLKIFVSREHICRHGKH